MGRYLINTTTLGREGREGDERVSSDIISSVR